MDYKTGEGCVLGAKLQERIDGLEEKMDMKIAITRKDFIILALIVFTASLLGNGGPHLLLQLLAK